MLFRDWSVGDICRASREYVGADPQDLLSSSRSARAIEARQITTAMLRVLRDMSFPEIAACMGRTSHAGFHRQWAKWLERDPEERFQILMSVSDRMFINSHARRSP